MKNIIAFLVTIVLFVSCDKNDKQLESNSLIITKQSEASGCLGKNNTKAESNAQSNIITLEAKGKTLLVYRRGKYNCGALIQLSVSNEGNTITIQEKNVGLSAMCDCPGEYQSEIKGMKDGIYTICVFPFKSYYGYFKPFVFEFKEGVKQTVELDLIYYNYLDLL
jgi:hypothetical protein